MCWDQDFLPHKLYVTVKGNLDRHTHKCKSFKHVKGPLTPTGSWVNCSVWNTLDITDVRKES